MFSHACAYVCYSTCVCSHYRGISLINASLVFCFWFHVYKYVYMCTNYLGFVLCIQGLLVRSSAQLLIARNNLTIVHTALTLVSKALLGH